MGNTNSPEDNIRNFVDNKMIRKLELFEIEGKDI
jgi:hypothetical protein